MTATEARHEGVLGRRGTSSHLSRATRHRQAALKEEQVMASNEPQPQQESDPQQLPEPDPAMASHKAQIHDRPRVARRTT
jgi:hypothetical protein